LCLCACALITEVSCYIGHRQHFNNNNNVVIALQTNNTLFLKTPDYVKTRKAKLHKANYLTKPIKELSANKNLVFNNGIISRDNKTIRLN
jgi:hypothetical protein